MKPSRRDFVRTSALGIAGLVALRGEARDSQSQNTALKLGLASYTFRNFERRQLIGFMKELDVMDLNAKDAKDHLPHDAAQETAALADYHSAKIHLHAAGAIYLKNDDEAIRAEFEYCKRAGIETMVVGDPVPESLPRIEKFSKEYSVQIAIHNHGPEDKIFPSPFEVLKAVKDMDPLMGCCIDVGHTTRAGADVVQAIHAAGPRLHNVHMKDLSDLKVKESQVAVGDGVMPVRAIFEALVAINYKGFVDLEYEIEADNPMPGVKKSFDFMRGVIRQVRRA